MKKYILNDKQRINEWIWQKVGRESPYEPAHSYQAFGVEEDGELIAGVVFDGFTTNVRCSMSCVGIGKRWLTREFLHICFDYVFNMAKCKVVINVVSAKNVESIKFTKHVGFKELPHIRDGDGDADLVILTLHRDECKWV